MIFNEYTALSYIHYCYDGVLKEPEIQRNFPLDYKKCYYGNSWLYSVSFVTMTLCLCNVLPTIYGSIKSVSIEDILQIQWCVINPIDIFFLLELRHRYSCNTMLLNVKKLFKTYVFINSSNNRLDRVTQSYYYINN